MGERPRQQFYLSLGEALDKLQAKGHLLNVQIFVGPLPGEEVGKRESAATESTCRRVKVIY